MVSAFDSASDSGSAFTSTSGSRWAAASSRPSGRSRVLTHPSNTHKSRSVSQADIHTRVSLAHAPRTHTCLSRTIQVHPRCIGPTFNVPLISPTQQVPFPRSHRRPRRRAHRRSRAFLRAATYTRCAHEPYVTFSASRPVTCTSSFEEWNAFPVSAFHPMFASRAAITFT